MTDTSKPCDAKPSFTPGPWMCNVRDQGGAGHSAYVGVEAPKAHVSIANVRCYDARLDRLPYEANAILIAAAPEMLKALREIEWLFDGQEDINSNGGPNDAMKALTVVRAALAKATGGKP